MVASLVFTIRPRVVCNYYQLLTRFLIGWMWSADDWTLQIGKIQRFWASAGAVFIPQDKPMNTSQSLIDIPSADVWEYLIPIRGSRRLETELLAPISIIYLVIFALGFFGNIILLWLILVNRAFHTPINYYLVNLSISDLLILALGLPHDLYMMWNRYPYPFEEVTCRLRALLAEASMISSVLTITALTIERYIAIIHPLSSATCGGAMRRALPPPASTSGLLSNSKLVVRPKHTDLFGCCQDWGRFKKVSLTLLVVWMLAPLFSLPMTLQVTLSYIYRNDSKTSFKSVRIEESSICTVSVSLCILPTISINF